MKVYTSGVYGERGATFRNKLAERPSFRIGDVFFEHYSGNDAG